ncbi:MAG: PD-(D/E)XK nuclease family protein [Anaerolineae bacterium]|nr:PD-(D/E)XK nuclease family protein [Anaerolineae bacterium]
MRKSLLLSRPKLAAFLTCARRFQLRSLAHLPWPIAPDDSQATENMTQGQQFHLLMERHFLGLDVPLSSIGDTAVSNWFQAFKNSNLVMENGRFLPEHRLTIPVGNHLLLGRFDLLVVGEQDGAPFAHIYDWKTGKARDESVLRQDWQTRLYLALLAEGGGALWPTRHSTNPRSLQPEAITLTYWYAAEPDAPRIIQYSQAQHARNWAEIQAIVAQIDDHLAQDHWPLTDEWAHCRNCAYQVYCGRQEAGLARSQSSEEADEDEPDWLLEPNLP